MSDASAATRIKEYRARSLVPRFSNTTETVPEEAEVLKRV